MLEVNFLNTVCEVEITRAKNNTRIQLYSYEDGFREPFATASCNVDGLKKDEVAIKDYSENEGMLRALMSAGIVYPPHKTIISGFAILPIVRLTDNAAAHVK